MIGDSLRHGLRQDGFTVDWIRDGEAAELALRTTEYAIVLLEFLATLRRTGNPIPVLIVTARDAVTDRVRGLDSGADDYLVKPFALEELTARLRALLRRHSGRAAPVITHGDLTLDPATRRVTRPPAYLRWYGPEGYDRAERESC